MHCSHPLQELRERLATSEAELAAAAAEAAAPAEDAERQAKALGRLRSELARAERAQQVWMPGVYQCTLCIRLHALAHTVSALFSALSGWLVVGWLWGPCYQAATAHYLFFGHPHRSLPQSWKKRAPSWLLPPRRLKQPAGARHKPGAMRAVSQPPYATSADRPWHWCAVCARLLQQQLQPPQQQQVLLHLTGRRYLVVAAARWC